MAAPITHIVFTDKVFNKFFPDKKREDFFIGTIFPDIRYFGIIGRNNSHFKGLKINDLKNENSFSAGLKFHSLLDEIRLNFIKSRNFYSLCPDLEHKIEALKLLEDELHYDKIKEWGEFVGFLNKILPEELDFGIKKEDIKRWHKIHQNYFSKKPDDKSREQVCQKLGFSKDEIDKMNNFIDKEKSNIGLKLLIEELYNDFEKFLI